MKRDLFTIQSITWSQKIDFNFIDLLFLQVFILEELLSPVITPFILIFCLRRKSLEIIDFFRNFTVDVVGVGDTCSFAQMDVRQHGHPAVSETFFFSTQFHYCTFFSRLMYHPSSLFIADSVFGPLQWMSAGKTEASIYQQAEDGKTELSLMHFAITNPHWQPPRESTHFISLLKEKVHREAAGGQQGIIAENPVFQSTHSLQSDSEVFK